MTKKQAHYTWLFVFDIPSLLLLWFGSKEISQLFSDIHHQVDMVRFFNTEGFIIMGAFMPVMHLVCSVEHLWPGFVDVKHRSAFSVGIILLLVVSIGSSIGLSSMIKRRVENAGYIDCRPLNWSGTFSVEYSYARNQAICEQQVAAAEKK